MRVAPEIWFVLDEPASGSAAMRSTSYSAAGLQQGQTIESVRSTLRGEGIEIPLHLTERRDVQGELPYLQTTGFRTVVSTLQVLRAIFALEITFVINGETHRRQIDVGLTDLDALVDAPTVDGRASARDSRGDP